MRTNRRKTLLLVTAAMVISVAVVTNQLARNHWDPTLFLSFSQEMDGMREYGERALGRDVIVRPFDGHDGQFYFIQASDPLLLDPERHVGLTDFPVYRGQRVFYPFVAGLGGLLDPSLIVWTLIGVNVFAMALGSWSVGALADHAGASSWWGLAFALNQGFVAELILDGSGVLAAALAFSGVLALQRGRSGYSAALFLLASLTREALVVVPLGAAAWLWSQRERRRAFALAGPSLIATALWAGYVRMQLQLWPEIGQTPNLGTPIVGIIESFRIAPSDFLHPATRIGVALSFFLYASFMLRGRYPLVAWSFAGFIPLGLLLTVDVWASYWNITRAVAPLLTALVILWVSRSSAVTSADLDEGVAP